MIRRLHPRLPAFTAEFTQSVPLTRIRDIAHGKGDDNGRCREVRVFSFPNQAAHCFKPLYDYLLCTSYITSALFYRSW